MKRFISIILGVAMVLSLIPSVFAAEEEPATVTYDFTSRYNKEDTANTDWIENIVASDGNFDDNTTYSIEKNSLYTGSGAYNWAYIGSNTNQSVVDIAATTPFKGKYIAISLANDVPYFGTCKAVTGGWVAFKINGIPKSGLYTVSAGTAYHYRNATSQMDMYIVPLSDVSDKLKSEDTFGEPGSKIVGDKHYGTKTDVTTFSSLNISENQKIGSANIYDTENVAVRAFAPTGTQNVELEADKEYALILHAASAGALSVASITLTEVIDKTHNYVLNTGMLGTSITGSTNDTQLFDSFDEIDEEKGTNDWAWKTDYSSSYSTYLQDSEMVIYATKSAVNSTACLQLDVNYNGTYDIGFELAELGDQKAYTEADVYMCHNDDVPEGVSTGAEIVKRLNHLGRIKGNESTADIKNVALKEGINYLFLRLNTDNPLTIAGAGGSSSNNRQYIQIQKITLTEAEEATTADDAVKVSNNVSFAAGAGVTVNGAEVSANETLTFTRGTEDITVTAPNEDETGNKFKCWVRGTADNGVFVSDENPYTFDIMTNTYLTPVYASADETAAEGEYKVEYYNWNGKYITTATTDGTVAHSEITPELAGYTFDFWTLDGETELQNGSMLENTLTRVVAHYTAKDTLGANAAGAPSYHADLDRVNINGVSSGKTAFDTLVECTDSGSGDVTYWMRDGMIVSYDKTYYHRIWNGTNIFSSYSAVDVKPIIILEDDAIDGAYMIEYDDGDKIVKEAGILFGGAGLDIDSCTSKATLQKDNMIHGQFMASPNGETELSEEYARGYLIYENNGELYVIYSAVVAVK